MAAILGVTPQDVTTPQADHMAAILNGRVPPPARLVPPPAEPEEPEELEEPEEPEELEEPEDEELEERNEYIDYELPEDENSLEKVPTKTKAGGAVKKARATSARARRGRRGRVANTLDPSA